MMRMPILTTTAIVAALLLMPALQAAYHEGEMPMDEAKPKMTDAQEINQEAQQVEALMQEEKTAAGEQMRETQKRLEGADAGVSETLSPEREDMPKH